MFANCKHEELSYPKNPKNVRPHSSNSIEALLKRQPHYSQVSHENATLSSGTPPLASYKEVPRSPPSPPPPTPGKLISEEKLIFFTTQGSNSHLLPQPYLKNYCQVEVYSVG